VDAATTDPAGARIFYGELFGWEKEPIKANGKLVYVSIKNTGSQNDASWRRRHLTGSPTSRSPRATPTKVWRLNSEVLVV